jgi:hypothetical protein
MASSVWQNILAAQQSGRMAGEALGGIGSGIYAAFNEGVTPEQQIEMRMRDKLYQQKLSDEIAQMQLKDPNLMEGSQAIQPGMTVDGQRSVKPLEMTPGQQEAMLVGQPIPEVSTVSLGGRAFDPAAIKSATIEDELRQAEAKRKLYETMGGNKAMYQFVPGLDGAGYSFNRGSGTATPTKIDGSESTLKVPEGITIKDIDQGGQIHRVGLDKQGNIAVDYGLAPVGVNTINDSSGNVVAAPSQAIPGRSISTVPVNSPGAQPGQPTGQPPQQLQVRTPGMETAKGLRDDIQQDKAVKDFNIIDGQFELMKQTMDESAKTGSYLATDQALVNLFNKMIAPDSVVMPSEYARTPGDQALLNRIAGMADRVMSGGIGLQPEDRKALFDLSQKFHGAWEKRYNERADTWKDIARRNKIDVKDLGLLERGQKAPLDQNESALMIRQQYQSGVITEDQARKMLEGLKK